MKYLRLLLISAALFFIFVPQSLAAQNKFRIVAPKTGVWQLTGKDEENTDWKGRIIFTRKTHSGKSIVKYKGCIVWSSLNSDSAGREYFSGNFDRRTGKLVLKGNRLKITGGNLALGVYTGFVNKKGRQISRGSWDGTNVVKGKWSARWLKFN